MSKGHTKKTGSDPGLAGVIRRFAEAPEVARLRDLLGSGRSARAGGLLGGSPALLLGAIASGLDAPILVVTPDPDSAADLALDLRLFLTGPSRLFPVSERRPSPVEPDQVSAERLLVLEGLIRGEVEGVVAPIHALLQPVPSPGELAAGGLRLRVGMVHPPDALSGRLAEAGLDRVALVEYPGQFARRGGIIDLCPPTAEGPYRIEFSDDTVESIRLFETESQRSIRKVDEIQVTLTAPAGGGTATVADYLTENTIVALLEPSAIAARAEEAQTLLGREGISHSYREILQPLRRRGGAILEMTSLPPPPGEDSLHLRVDSLQGVAGEISEVANQLRSLIQRGDQVLVFCTTTAERERFEEILEDNHIQGATCCTAPLSRGFALPELGCAVLTNREIFGRYRERREPRRLAPGRPVDAFWDLKPGDWVVHLSQGIGRFQQIIRMKKRGKWQEFLVVEYRGGVKLHVPASRIDLVQKYVGARGLRPKLSVLGGTAWQKKKADVASAVEDFASDLLEVQAARNAQEGIQFPRDEDWQLEFESSFPFPDTPDQAQTNDEIKTDMTALRPMDRLVCGDVGYGKTELAVRAAFKAAIAGYQVAILVPTTVLAEQHFRTFTERMADYPVKIEVLSRFRSRAEQRGIIERAARGEVEILIGTHRILSSDVIFRNLGLVVIDEEQRFGVRHKEVLKQLRCTVDVLTLTATPIPRTLHMALLGIRDISSLATPPRDRLAIQTRIVRFDEHLIREAILLEKARGGQVFLVHNRVQSIDKMAARLRKVVPEATFEVVHGQMKETTLEERMVRFIGGEVDVLVTTTIIESGLDLPNVNTLIINMADRFGLADLHQLRGRVGRYRNRAHAYMLLPERGPILPTAEKRLRAIEEFSDLGSGFQIAMRDLEIRGAGNILGSQQSGHIASVGYDLYCKILSRAVSRRRDEQILEAPDVDILLDMDAFIPEEYVPHQGVRFQIYRRFASAAAAAEIDELREELRDRFGAPPEPVEGLFTMAGLRLAAAAWGITGLVRQDEGLEIRHGDRARLAPLQTHLPLRIAHLDDRTVLIPYEGIGMGTQGVARRLLEAMGRKA